MPVVTCTKCQTDLWNTHKSCNCPTTKTKLKFIPTVEQKTININNQSKPSDNIDTIPQQQL